MCLTLRNNSIYMTLYNYVLYYQITTHLGRSTGADVILRARRNVLHVGMVLVAAYMLCWTYLTVLHAMWVHGLTKYGDVKWNAAVAVILVNSCVNLFIYSMRYQEFQKNAKLLMCQKCRH